MTHYDPAKVPCDPNYGPYRDYLESGQSNIIGPGGNTTLIENNEKGVLETNLFKTINTLQSAALGSDHDSHKQGIYAQA